MDQTPVALPTSLRQDSSPLPRWRRVGDLDSGEQLVLWALRQWLEGAAGETRVRQELFAACGLTRVEAAVQSFENLLETLGGHARRVLVLHRAACPRLSRDEEMLLSLIAALQAKADTLVEAQLCWLVARPRAAALADHAGCFAAALAAAGHRLPLHLPKAAAPWPRSALPMGARSSVGSTP